MHRVVRFGVRRWCGNICRWCRTTHEISEEETLETIIRANINTHMTHAAEMTFRVIFSCVLCNLCATMCRWENEVKYKQIAILFPSSLWYRKVTSVAFFSGFNHVLHVTNRLILFEPKWFSVADPTTIVEETDRETFHKTPTNQSNKK